MRITSKGQVTIPIDIREASLACCRTPKSSSSSSATASGIRKAPNRQGARAAASSIACAAPPGRGMTTDEIMALTRGRCVAVTLVDANVILDIVTEDPEWLDWSAAALEDAGEHGPLAINPIIYAEVSTSVRSD